jgi:MFS transporter, FHS family, glucose/mannose:H+ symporter
VNWRLQLGLALNLVVFATVLNSVGIVVERSISEWDIAKSVGGTLEGCKDITIALTSLVLGSQVPRWGYRRVMLGGLAAVASICFLLAFVQKFWTVPLLFIVCGASFALVKVAVYATVGLNAKDPAQHATLMNRLEGIYQVGALVAPLVFSWMIASGNWINTYWFVAALAASAFGLWTVTPLAQVQVAAKSSGGPSDVRGLLARKDVKVFLISAGVYVMIEQSIGTWLPTFYRDVFQLQPENAARMLSVYFGSLAVSRFAFGTLVRRIPVFALQLAYLAGAFATLTIVLVGTAGNSPWQGLAPLLAFVGFFIGPIYPTLNSMMLSSLDKSLHSAMTGLIIVASALGGTLGSQILGSLSQNFTTHKAFHFPLFPIALLALLLVVFQKMQSTEQPTNEPST